jgi:alpha-beta hydrolase superfamily lysophospholipase
MPRPTRKTIVAALRMLAAALLGYTIFLGYLYLRQEALIFYPEPLPADYRFDLDHPGQRVDEVRIPVPDGEIHALHFRQPAPRGLVFYLHGNGGNLASWSSNADFYRDIGFDLFMLDYRGYGKSRGRIDSEAQLHADARAAWDRVAPSYAGKPVAIIGRSLGTGLATRLARDVHPALLVLVTPYTSAVELAREQYPFAPGWLMRYPLRSDALIGDIASPILLIHGTKDELTPLAHSRKLLALARSPAALLLIDGAGHDDIHTFSAYRSGLAERLQHLAR